jgi:hypothetical protein
MLMAKELISTTLVEIIVENFSLLWKSFPATSFSTFPQGDFSQPCGNVENFQLILIYKELN